MSVSVLIALTSEQNLTDIYISAEILRLLAYTVGQCKKRKHSEK